ncbi:MAG: HPF/RaiA family ribosome-associated protein, partial [Gemmatimonadetes bacterium]|nr:HPF/RaiA family ribosome-associated protein [Gemmatimonadota bacterium]
MMDVIVTARHCEIPADERERIREQMQGLQRFEPRSSRAEVVVTGEKNRFVAEAVLSIDRGARIHGEAAADEARSAVDRLVEKLAT